MENEYRSVNGGTFESKNKALLSKEQAVQLMRTCIELAQYRDCLALPDVRFAVLLAMALVLRSMRHVCSSRR